MDIGAELRELGRNLYWTWQPDVVEIFRSLDPALWREVNHNPVEFLNRVPDEALQAKASELALEARINHAFHRLRDYLDSHDTWGATYAGPLRARPVALFSAEFGLHESLPIYSGGLGVLAGDHLKAASDLGVPVVGVGLFYAKGYFTQKLDAEGWQHEEYFAAEMHSLPMDPARDSQGNPLQVRLTTIGSEIAVQLWTARVGRNRLILLDSNTPANSDQDRGLTSQLYGGDSRTRIRQELILGVGGLRALKAMGITPGVIHLNEGHSAFAVLELALQIMRAEGRSFPEVRERVASMTVFTTHTPVPAGHDRFEPHLLEETLGPLRSQLGISEGELLSLGRVRPDDREEPFCMTVLGLKMSRHRNAVSSIHARVSREMWRDLWPGRAEDEPPIEPLTNGVHLATWLAVPMARLYDRCLGPDWQQRVTAPETWAKADQINSSELWEQQQILKTRLVEYVRRCVGRQEKQRHSEVCGEAPTCLDPSILTIGFARRFATYKRGDLLLRDTGRLAGLVSHPERPVQIILAGKAHPADEWGKQVIQRVFAATKDPRFAGRIVFLEDYDINVGRHMVQGVDLWLNLPRRPLEACGTSGQKVILNGGLNLSVLDGWWAEAYDGTNGFAVGSGAEHADPSRQDDLDAQALYDVLENDVVPLFYTRDANGIPLGWVARQKNAIRTLAWRFGAQRMVMEHTLRHYLPAAGAWWPAATGAPPPRF